MTAKLYAMAHSHPAIAVRLMLEHKGIDAEVWNILPGLHPIAEQAHRVAAVVESGLWVNARTDLFLRKLIAGENANDRSLLGEALERAQAYAEAGAHSFFVPGITDLELIAEICAAAPLPVNVIKPAEHDFPALAAAGVARISWGPRPWIWAMARLTEEAKALYAAR